MSGGKSKQKTIKKRKPQKKGSKKQSQITGKKVILFLVKAFTAGIILFSIFFIAVYLGFTGHVPSSRQLNEIINPQASEVFSSDGKLLGRYYVENRSNVNFDEISPNVINALIATEDSRFYEHRGIDEIALLRVLFKTILLHDRSAGGGSTLSQQIAKNLFPRNDLGVISLPVNKLREAIIAYRLERIYSKEEILTLYLNTVPFGENIFGIELAAERYFSKSPLQLTVDEAAVLIGMLKANNRYNPRINPEKSKERRNIVITQMVKNNFLTAEEGNHFTNKPLEIHYRKISYNEGPAPYFLEIIKPELLDWCASNMKESGEPYNLYTDGLKIETTIHYDYQYFARQSVSEYMKNLQRVFDNHWKNSEPWGRNADILNRAVQRTDRYKKMVESGYSEEQIKAAFNKKIKTRLFTWNGFKEVETTPLDSVKHYLKFLNAGFLAIDPASGELKAWVGGIDFRFFKYDHVLSKRQTGSTFKPFIYLAALENGISPFDYYPNKRKVYEKYQNWSPTNSHDDYTGYYTMEGALAQSINTISVDILMKTGIDNAIEKVRQLGIRSDLPEVPSLALGVASISLKEMLFAYATIINGGKRVVPYYLLSISDKNGDVLEEFATPPARPTDIDPVNCKVIRHMMETAINEGTGKKIRSVYKIPGDFAGKTGTTQNQSDGWFVGITPHLIAGCWVGGEDRGIHFRTITYGQGSYMALPIVGKFYYKLYRDPHYKQFQYTRFPEMNEQLLADLNIPPYKEMLEIDKKDNLLDRLFAGKSKEEKLREIQEPKKQKEKKNLWQAIKNIFKKK
jgi:penicillin-binding protein 1A